MNQPSREPCEARRRRVTMHNSTVWQFTFLAALIVGGRAMADQVLYDFSTVADPGALQASDVQVSKLPFGDGVGLKLVTGHAADWPGITLPAPDGHWDLSQRADVLLDIRNLDANEVTVYCRVDNPRADGVKNCITGSTTVAPGGTATLRTTLRHRSLGAPPVELFGMRGYPYNQSDQGTLDTTNVTGVVIFVARPERDHQFAIGNLRAEGEHEPVPPWPANKPFLPLIDTFGQYLHRDWPGKVHSLAELKGRVAEEQADLDAHPGPEGWDQYGGWANGPQLEATGFFRTAKQDGKWWLVDPDGRLFFSHGIDCVGLLDSTPVSEREDWFQDYPGAQPDLAEFASKGWSLHGHWAGQTSDCYNFTAANLKRKYGDEWRQRSASQAHQRLRSWGLNTIANWSSRTIWLMDRTPYTANVGFKSRLLEGSQGYWGKFRDVFDPSFARGIADAMAGQVGVTANDPWCIGYFIDNEIAWGDDTSLAVAALKSPAEQPAKLAFVADLRAKYQTIDRLNAAWGTAYASWDSLLESVATPDPVKAREDLTAFYTHSAETYFEVIRDAVRAVAPHQLYLGCRFSVVNPLATAAAGKYCDVVSYNLYRRSVADFKPSADIDVPLIIGEFHFGALDRGMFHTGLVPVGSQSARAEAYRSYVTGALQHPQFVGCGWFQYQDEPTTGRTYDEENYQIGFVDICDTPYPETIGAARAVGARIYEVRREGR